MTVERDTNAVRQPRKNIMLPYPNMGLIVSRLLMRIIS